MTKEVLYLYLGTNGTILSPVHLEDIYYVRKLRLTPAPGKLLTRDGKTLLPSATIAEADLNDWYEVEGQM